MPRFNPSQFLEKLQKKPEHVRVTILWTITTLIVLIMLGLWVISTKNRVAGLFVNTRDLVPKDQQTAGLKSSVSDLFQSFDNARRDLTSFFQKQQADIESGLEGPAPAAPATVNRPLPLPATDR